MSIRPWGFATEGLAFRLFGDHFFVERLYSLAMFALTALAMTRIWRRFLPPRYGRASFFLGPPVDRHVGGHQ